MELVAARWVMNHCSPQETEVCSRRAYTRADCAQYPESCNGKCRALSPMGLSRRVVLCLGLAWPCGPISPDAEASCEAVPGARSIGTSVMCSEPAVTFCPSSTGPCSGTGATCRGTRLCINIYLRSSFLPDGAVGLPANCRHWRSNRRALGLCGIFVGVPR